MSEIDNLTIAKNQEGTLTTFGINPRSTNVETLRTLISTLVSDITKKSQFSVLNNDGSINYIVEPSDFSRISQMPEARKKKEINKIVTIIKYRRWVSVIQKTRA